MTILKYPKSLPKALTQAIYYVHFEKVVESELKNEISQPQLVSV